MVREDLVSSAVSFLQDPSVAASSLDKRIAFLQSKNLTQDEIDTALARAGDASQASNVPPPTPPQPQYGYQGQQMRQATGYNYGYGPYQGGPWSQGPPEPPRRDWRDWFIMATVTSGIGYGLYAVAKRYVVPLISPPTPPQLEADKAAIDASFNRAFALIDQLTTDTATLKASETERTEKVDTTLRDVDSVIGDLKAANSRHESESRIIADQVIGLKELIPKALEGWKANEDKKLEDLGREVQSLKKLLENRVGRTGGASTPTGRGFPPSMMNGNDKTRDNLPGTPSTSNGASVPNVESPSSSTAPAPGVNVPKRDGSTTSTTTGTGKGDSRAKIPAWQMAASSKSGTASPSVIEETGSEDPTLQ